jgi:hypothetical protein
MHPSEARTSVEFAKCPVETWSGRVKLFYNPQTAMQPSRLPRGCFRRKSVHDPNMAHDFNSTYTVPVPMPPGVEQWNNGTLETKFVGIIRHKSLPPSACTQTFEDCHLRPTNWRSGRHGCEPHESRIMVYDLQALQQRLNSHP